MPAALPTILRRIQDQEDAPTLGVGQDGYALTWDNSSSAFVATALAAGVTINDATTTLTEVWSSLKTSNEIGTVNSSLSSHTGDATIHRVINDGSTATTVLWSGSKINSDITTVSGDLTTHTSDATIHRAINDASTASTVLWSASKINTELAGKGAGDFLADGTVAMTGSLNVASTGIVSNDADSTHLFGRVALGYDGVNSDRAIFAHRDHANATSAAFYQGAGGGTVFNAASGGSVLFRINGVSFITLNASGLDFLDTPISSDDDDVSYDFGRAKLGYDATNTDRAIFAHRDHATSTAAAFAQEADGDAIINAPTGQTIQFKSNGSDTVRINSAGQLGVGTTSIDALFHVEDGAAGAAALGSDVIALFESNANMGIQMSAPTNSNFTIRANTPAGSATDLTLEYRSQFATLDIELGATYGYNAGQAIFGPRVDNIAALGSTSNRYTEVWAVDGTINTSDSDDKEGIVNASLGLDFINRLQPKEWKWKESKTIVDGKVKFKAAKDKRKHTGLVAQDVKAVLDDLKINTKDFAGYISGEDGKLGLRYHEFTAPMIKAIQELSARVEQLEAA